MSPVRNRCVESIEKQDRRFLGNRDVFFVRIVRHQESRRDRDRDRDRERDRAKRKHRDRDREWCQFEREYF